MAKQGAAWAPQGQALPPPASYLKPEAEVVLLASVDGAVKRRRLPCVDLDPFDRQKVRRVHCQRKRKGFQVDAGVAEKSNNWELGMNNQKQPQSLLHWKAPALDWKGDLLGFESYIYHTSQTCAAI